MRHTATHCSLSAYSTSSALAASAFQQFQPVFLFWLLAFLRVRWTRMTANGVWHAWHRGGSQKAKARIGRQENHSFLRQSSDNLKILIQTLKLSFVLCFQIQEHLINSPCCIPLRAKSWSHFLENVERVKHHVIFSVPQSLRHHKRRSWWLGEKSSSQNDFLQISFSILVQSAVGVRCWASNHCWGEPQGYDYW